MSWLSSVFGFFKSFQLWVTVAPWEMGLRVRLGKTATVLCPGPHWRIPFLDRMFVQQVRLRSLGIGGQTVTTKDGKPLSAVISFYHRGACMPYWHGAAAGARAMRSNEVLYFLLMRQSRERGLTTFDFGRSKVGTGPAAWKKTWGFEGEPLGYYLRTAPGKGIATLEARERAHFVRTEASEWDKLAAELEQTS